MKRWSLFSTAVLASAAFTTAGLAADLPVKAPVVAPPPFSWTGFYVGANIGGVWSQRDWNDWTDVTRNVLFRQSANARFIAGGQVGLNYQINNFVLGAEADGDWIAHNNNVNGTGIVIPGVAGGPFKVNSDGRWISTVAARFGIAADHALFYGKAGGGWIGETGLTVTNLATGAAITGSNNSSRSG